MEKLKVGRPIDPESIKQAGATLVQVDLLTRERLGKLAKDKPINRYLRQLVSEELERVGC